MVLARNSEILDMQDLEDKFFLTLYGFFPGDEARKELAQTFIDQMKLRRGQMELKVKMERERLARFACMLHPAQKNLSKKNNTFLNEWAQEFAYFGDEEQKSFIAEMYEILDEMPRKRADIEGKNYLYLSFIEMKEIYTEASTYRTEDTLKKFKEDNLIIVKPGEDINETIALVIDGITESLPKMSEEDRAKKGQKLLKELIAIESEENKKEKKSIDPVDMAVYYLSAAYIGHQEKACRTKTESYIGLNIKETVQKKDILAVLEAMRENATSEGMLQKDSMFDCLSVALKDRLQKTPKPKSRSKLAA